MAGVAEISGVSVLASLKRLVCPYWIDEFGRSLSLYDVVPRSRLSPELWKAILTPSLPSRVVGGVLCRANMTVRTSQIGLLLATSVRAPGEIRATEELAAGLAVNFLDPVSPTLVAPI